MTLKMVPEAACGPENSSESRLWYVNLLRYLLHPMRGRHWRKSTNEKEVKPRQNYHVAFGTIFRIRKCFHGSKINLYISQKGNLKNLKPTAYVQKVQIWSFRPSKYYSSSVLIPLNAGCVSLIRLSLALLLLFIVGRRWMNVLHIKINISSLASKHNSANH